MNDEFPRIKEQVYYGQINSCTDVFDKFLSENGLSRYNPQIIVDGKVKATFASLASSILGGESVLNEINYLNSPETGCGQAAVLPLDEESLIPDDFGTTDYTVNGQKAFFANITLSKTFTMNLDVPEPWLVEDVVAVYASSLKSTSSFLSLCHCAEKDRDPAREPPLQLKAGQLFSFIFSDLSSFILIMVNRLQMESADSIDEALELHHIKGAFVETVLSKAKPPLQEILLKLEKESSQESSFFVFKLGVGKLQCCLLMNGLVFDSIEIIVDGKVEAMFVSLALSILGGESVLSEINYLHSPETMDDVKPVTIFLMLMSHQKKG
ncbi:hypothetical protein CRYUN_Cryun01aG0197800 [Craigia yunnanensis]